MTTISATYDTLFTQAGDTVEAYLRRSIRLLDGEFGEGYARENPVLVGAMISAMTKDFASSSFGKVVGELADVIRDQTFSN